MVPGISGDNVRVPTADSSGSTLSVRLVIVHLYNSFSHNTLPLHKTPVEVAYQSED